MSFINNLDSGFVRKASATNTDSSSSLGRARLDNEFSVNKFGGVDRVQASSYDTNPTVFKSIQDKPASTQANPVEYLGTQIPINYKFNLPPHDWSLPLRPSAMDPELVKSPYENASFHGYRRGRIWYWQTAGDVSSIDNTTGAVTKASDASKNKAGVKGAESMLLDRNYGFQFLYNPETIQTNVARNMDITPSSADTLRVVAGVFPGQETVSLSIILDRTNDFAYAKATGRGSSNYYTSGFPDRLKQNFDQQLKDLLAQGTMADLEYLFRAINGAGSGDKQWTTLLGKKTANVGYLQPTLLGIALGPLVHENLSYVGWISNVSITHTAFTETMIPLRTQVSLSIECFSGSGISGGA
ncbi:hypothetical protein UFOVP696_38 [uncultured Caudovirales phage]|jgi:hypothetical protein|uniref:Uncharacterized protein n=1 Tax=uncultured Caudovirales phage TaxID=2100421 RepID=A0A6J5MP64_9CAUD|nr:hypothetical protein UFOVP429_129 [uncultured Caudovirales phage]CAB4158169.1 hypothetical protein UFOVP696_38 [uncultured Caudovirales phage]